MTAPTAPRPVDVHALPAMLTALRLPSFHRHWQALADRADAEGWPASRFLAALAEIELAERDARRIQRHLQQSQLPGGKTLATLDFKALPGVTRAHIEALAAGDRDGRANRSSARSAYPFTICARSRPTTCGCMIRRAPRTLSACFSDIRRNKPVKHTRRYASILLRSARSRRSGSPMLIRAGDTPTRQAGKRTACRDFAGICTSIPRHNADKSLGAFVRMARSRGLMPEGAESYAKA